MQHHIQVLESRGFREVRKIGAGGEATVYQAFQKELGECAVKVHHQPVESFDKLPRHVKEGVEFAMAIRNNPFVISLLSSFVEDQLFTVWDLAQESLRERFDLRLASGMGGWSQAETISLLENVAKGLDAIHSRPAAHGDIKMDNLLCFEHDFIKIGDFGTSRVISSLTTRQTRVLSEFYALPEHLGVATRDRDLFAFAVTYAEMRLGRHPYGSESNEIITNLKNNSPDLRGVRGESLHGVLTAEEIAALFAVLNQKSSPSVCQLLEQLQSEKKSRELRNPKVDEVLSNQASLDSKNPSSQEQSVILAGDKLVYSDELVKEMTQTAVPETPSASGIVQERIVDDSPTLRTRKNEQTPKADHPAYVFVVSLWSAIKTWTVNLLGWAFLLATLSLIVTLAYLYLLLGLKWSLRGDGTWLHLSGLAMLLPAFGITAWIILSDVGMIFRVCLCSCLFCLGVIVWIPNWQPEFFASTFTPANEPEKSESETRFFVSVPSGRSFEYLKRVSFNGEGDLTAVGNDAIYRWNIKSAEEIDRLYLLPKPSLPPAKFVSESLVDDEILWQPKSDSFEVDFRPIDISLESSLTLGNSLDPIEDPNIDDLEFTDFSTKFFIAQNPFSSSGELKVFQRRDSKVIGRITPTDATVLTSVKISEISSEIYSFIVRETRTKSCLLYTSPSPRDRQKSRMPSSA